MNISSELLHAIETNTRLIAAQTCTAQAVGPFVALFHPSDPAPWFNYAMPVAPLDDEPLTLAALAELQAVFQQHRRRLRFEWTQSLWPSLPGLLQQAGLLPESISPQMICTPASWRHHAAPNVGVRLLTLADPLKDYRTLTNRGFGRVAEASPDEVAELRQALEAGWVYGLAELEGRWAGVGGFMPLDGLTEIVAVATHPQLRRRGVAATLTSFLAAQHFANAGTAAFLFAADAGAQAAYARVGFHTCAMRLSYIA
jgi:ribosomal protein S18 acetylase RimI-like enzyme